MLLLSDRQFHAVAAVLLFLAALLAYANTLSGDWVWDDASSVLLHETVREGRVLQLFAEDQHAYGRGEGNFYRPLVAASFALDYALSYNPARDLSPDLPYPDVKPLVFHVSNLLWHAAAAVLLFFLLRRLSTGRTLALIVAGLYAVHPLHTEAVAYISGRADMMSAVFMYAGLLFALWQAAGSRMFVAWLLTALCFVSALLSKESSFIFPLLLLLVLLVKPASDARHTASPALLRFMPLVIALVLFSGYALLRTTVLSFAVAQDRVAAPFGQRVMEAGQGMYFYLTKLFYPTHLHMEQTLAGFPAWTSGLGWIAIVAMAALCAWAWRTGQRRVVGGFTWFLITWLPISGLFPLNAPIAEHWMYVPMAGFWWGLGELLLNFTQAPVARRVLATGAAVLLLGFLYGTVARNRDWRNNEALFRSTVAENPDTLRVHYNLAVAYEDLQENYAGATRHFEKVVELQQRQKQGKQIILRDEIEVYLSLGNILLEQEEYGRALQYFGPIAALADAEQFKEPIAAASMGMARGFYGLGEIGRAAEFADKAVRLVPEYRPQSEALLLGGALS